MFRFNAHARARAGPRLRSARVGTHRPFSSDASSGRGASFFCPSPGSHSRLSARRESMMMGNTRAFRTNQPSANASLRRRLETLDLSLALAGSTVDCMRVLQVLREPGEIPERLPAAVVPGPRAHAGDGRRAFDVTHLPDSCGSPTQVMSLQPSRPSTNASGRGDPVWCRTPRPTREPHCCWPNTLARATGFASARRRTAPGSSRRRPLRFRGPRRRI